MKESYEKVTAEDIKRLRDHTGVGMIQCRDAIQYAIEHEGGERLAVAYLKAKGIAVATPKLTFDERVLYFYEE